MQQRRLAAIMFTDIVGYTSQMGKDEGKALAQLEHNRAIHKEYINKFKGQLIKEMGDGILSSFDSVSNAIYCATLIQKACKEKDILLKIGIHEGEMVFEGIDVLGDGVNVASRIQEVSGVGCVTISERVYQSIRNRLEFKAEFIEEKRLKNVVDPVKIYKVYCEGDIPIPDVKESKTAKNKKLTYYILGGLVVVIAAFIIWYTLPGDQDTSATNEIGTGEISRSIAVLPFRNLSGDPDLEHLSDGLTDEILNHLFKIRSFDKVVSFSSVMTYKDSDKRIPEIANDLDVTYVLEGTFKLAGDTVRVTAQLIDAKLDKHLWSEPYIRPYGDIFEIQSSIAKKIAETLNAVLTPDEERRLGYIPSANDAAYELWIRGRQEMLRGYWGEIDNKHAKTAMQFFNEALELDPEYAEALAAKGEVYLFLSYERKYDSALYYCNWALELEPELILGHWIRGVCYQIMGEYDNALKDLIKTEELSPNYPGMLYPRILNIYFNQKKDYVKGMTYLSKYIEKDPSSGHYYAGEFFNKIGDYKKAEDHFLRQLQYGVDNCWQMLNYYSHTLIVQGKNIKALNFLDSICNVTECENLCYSKKWLHCVNMKDFEEANKYYNLLTESGGSITQWDSIGLAYMYMNINKNDEALLILNSLRYRFEIMLERESGDRYPLNQMPSIYALLNEKEKALDYLSEFAKQGFDGGMQDLAKNSPLYENLWDDPEFQAIINREQERKAAIRAQIQEMMDQEGIGLSL